MARLNELAARSAVLTGRVFEHLNWRYGWHHSYVPDAEALARTIQSLLERCDDPSVGPGVEAMAASGRFFVFKGRDTYHVCLHLGEYHADTDQLFMNDDGLEDDPCLT